MKGGRGVAAVALAAAVAFVGCSASSSYSKALSSTTTSPATVPVAPGTLRSPGCSTAPPRPGTTRLTLTVAGRHRTALVTVPAAPHGAAAPLVLLFHGYGSSGQRISDLTHLPQRAAAQGMVAVAPDGTRRTWGVTDPPFVDALLRHVEQTQCIDLHRVFLTGFSAGAAFSISYGCAHQDRIAALAPVAVDLLLGCSRPTSILVFHGTADPLVAYAAGGEGQSLPGAKLPGTLSDMRSWAHLGGCDPTPTTRHLASQVTRLSWTGCTGTTEVVLYRINGGGHTWPGADPQRAFGLTTRQVSATDRILAFFARHRLGG